METTRGQQVNADNTDFDSNRNIRITKDFRKLTNAIGNDRTTRCNFTGNSIPNSDFRPHVFINQRKQERKGPRKHGATDGILIFLKSFLNLD